MPWQKLSPEAASEIAPWTSDEKEPPLFQRVMKATWRYRKMKERMRLLALLLSGIALGLVIAQFLPFYAWIGILATGFVLEMIFAFESFRSYLVAERMQLESLQNVREIEIREAEPKKKVTNGAGQVTEESSL